MTILTGGVLANQYGVWEGRNTVGALFFYALRFVISCFHVLEYWHKTSAPGVAQQGSPISKAPSMLFYTHLHKNIMALKF